LLLVYFPFPHPTPAVTTALQEAWVNETLART
jgi:hypothetical protein